MVHGTIYYMPSLQHTYICLVQVYTTHFLHNRTAVVTKRKTRKKKKEWRLYSFYSCLGNYPLRIVLFSCSFYSGLFRAQTASSNFPLLQMLSLFVVVVVVAACCYFEKDRLSWSLLSCLGDRRIHTYIHTYIHT